MRGEIHCSTFSNRAARKAKLALDGVLEEAAVRIACKVHHRLAASHAVVQQQVSAAEQLWRLRRRNVLQRGVQPALCRRGVRALRLICSCGGGGGGSASSHGLAVRAAKPVAASARRQQPVVCVGAARGAAWRCACDRALARRKRRRRRL